ncbi:MAG TPA: Hpt domain-containing protein, partial [Bacillaceae bacterium]
MDMDQYLDVFIDESKEHLQSCSEKLLELEKNPGSLEIVNEIFRSAHTLKGMAATMGFEDLASLTHTMENVLDGIRGERIAASQEAMDAIFSAMDDLEAMIESISSGGDGKRDVTVSVAQLVKIEKGEESVQNTVLAETAASIAVPSPHGLDMDYGPFDLAMIEQSR